jgi:hypothetical protein
MENIAQLSGRVLPGSYLIVRANGSEELIAQRPTDAAVRAAINADTFDVVVLSFSSRTVPDLVMIVDDRGYEIEEVDHGDGPIELVPVRAKLPVNPRATWWFWEVCKPGATHEIIGDVVIARDGDFAPVATAHWPGN